MLTGIPTRVLVWTEAGDGNVIGSSHLHARVGTLRKQLALYEQHGYAVQKKHFGEPLAWLVAKPAT
jgi:hypothetical protein